MENRVVLITGSTQGIGLGTAKLFLEKGYRVVVNGRTEESVLKATQELRAWDKVFGAAADVGERKSGEKLVAKVLEKWGRVDILINNAGVISWGEFLEQKESDYKREVEVNLVGVLNLCQIVGKLMKKQKKGVIVNIASGAGKRGHPGLAVYSATKFGVLGFTQAFAREAEEFGFRVYAICPGATQTQMTNYSGMAINKVAQRIVDCAEEKLGLQSGQDCEIYY